MSLTRMKKVSSKLPDRALAGGLPGSCASRAVKPCPPLSGVALSWEVTRGD